MLDSDEAGLKSVTFSMTGENAYGYLRSEIGVHRLVRISPFIPPADGTPRLLRWRFCRVDDSIQIDIRPEDIKWMSIVLRVPADRRQ